MSDDIQDPSLTVDSQAPQIVARSFSGPVPDPDTLKKYELIQSGFADRIMQMAEKEQTYRHDKNNSQLKFQFDLDKQESDNYRIGLVLAFLSVASIVSLCVYAFHLGYASQSAVIATGVIVGLAGVFVIRKYQEDKSKD